METMNEVYVITERLYKRAYNAEPWKSERVIKVCGDYFSAILNVRNLILEDHAILDRSGKDLTHFTKHEPHLRDVYEDCVLTSYSYSDEHYYETKSYRFVSYKVE